MFVINKAESLFKSQTKDDFNQIILNIIPSGDAVLIESTATKFQIKLKDAIDTENMQNGCFYAALIKNKEDSLAIMKYLIQNEVNPFLRDLHNQNCLYYFCREGNVAVAKYLIEEMKMDISEPDIYGQNPFFYSAREGHLELCQYLQSKGINIHASDTNGQNALFYAIQGRHFAIVKYLVEEGINVNLIDKSKISPLGLSNQLKELAISKLLVKHGAVTNESPVNLNVLINTKKRIKHTLANINTNDNNANANNNTSNTNNTENNNNNTNTITDKLLGRKKERKNKELSQFSKDELIESIQHSHQYVLIRINEQGDKIPLTIEDIASLKINYPDAAKLLDDKNALIKAVSELNEDLLLHESWEKQAGILMNSLWRFKDSSIFHHPVDPKEEPNYFELIKKPIDFSAIKRKLKYLQYTNFKQFCIDVNLVFENCKQFNGDNSSFGVMCKNVKTEFKRLFIDLSMEKFL